MTASFTQNRYQTRPGYPSAPPPVATLQRGAGGFPPDGGQGGRDPVR